MKKNIFKIAIPVLVLVLLIGVYFALNAVDGSNGNSDKTDDNLITEYTSLLSVSADLIDEYSISTSDYSYKLVKNDGEWKVKDKDYIKLDSVAVSNIINAVSVLNAEDVIEKPEEMKVYGLENPSTAEINVCADGKNYNIKVGNKAPTNDRYYVIFGDELRVYTLYNATCEAFLQSLNDIRIKTLHNISEEGLKSQDEFVSFELIKPGKPSISIRRKTAEETEKDIAANAYIMDSPYYKNVNTDTFEQYVFEKIPLLKIESYIADMPSDLAEYGLDEQNKTALKLQTVNELLSIEIGKSENGLYYAKFPDENSVFTLDANNLTVLTLETYKLLDPNIYIAYIGDVETVEFKDGNEVTVFRIEDLGNNSYKYYANNKEVEEDKFKAIYQEIIALSFTAPTNGSYGSSADYEYSFKFRDGREDNVKFISESERNYVAVVNGKAEFSLDKGQVNSLVEKISEFK